MIPAAILEARAHVLSEGANKGKPLDSLDDVTLTAVVNWYRPRDFLEWRAAMLTANWRVIERAGLATMSHRDLQWASIDGDVTQRPAAKWYLEYFGKGACITVAKRRRRRGGTVSAPQTLEVTVKKWYTSKTIWVNVLALAIVIIPVLLDAINATVISPEVQRLIAVWGAAILSIANIVLRWLTNQGLTR